ncbi:hypothetical protein BKP35_17965 [Anaerobacillus arseniciselenatis]|uniref:Methyl-accepting chemotaxis protein n=1 Tax=Anaerobacillus arseniciselenatis TaxID=85682 RepID=A0A1S2L8X5_9BACI|nr:methyl-accepting chemotaxis protein [Anaerobacillus arseniciselenatis]OIJ08217.1 hypothetical protein BKP35_17965 [Anaerobacillus arseniciselenatis]
MNRVNIFSLGMNLMNRLTYMKKFSMILLLFMVPFIILLALMIHQLNGDIEFAETERKGIEYIDELRSLVQLAQQHRGLSVVYLQGGSEVRPDIEIRQQNIATTIEHIGQVNNRLGEHLVVGNRWDELKAEWNHIAADVFSLDAETSIELHNDFIKNMLDFQMYLATTSNLILDPDEANYFLVGTILEDLPNMTENMGISRAYGTAVVNNRSLSVQENIDLTFNLRAMEDRYDASVTKFGFAFSASPDVENALQEQFNAVRNASTDTMSLIEQEILNASVITMGTNTFFSVTTEAIDSVYSLMDKGAIVLDNRLVNQINTITFQRNIMLTISIIVTLLIMYFFTSFYLGVRNTVMHIKDTMEQFANGDLTVTTSLVTKDETKEIGIAFNQMAESFRKMVTHNKEISEQLAASSEEVTASIDQTTEAIQQMTEIIDGVANGAQSQVVGANESAQASDEMAQAIQKIAESSNVVSELSTITTDKAEKGRTSVDNSVHQFNNIKEFVLNVSTVIQELNQHSKEIGHISTLINGVAEQTNLLALNAAIEAARAGEHGKGFAVVADEVRKLAEETKTSTDKITHIVHQVQDSTNTAVKMMDEGTTKVESGTKIVESLGIDFQDIVFAINKMSEQVHEVSALSEQMSANSEEVAASVNELSQIAEDNSGNLQTVAASTEEQLATMQEINSSATELSKTAEALNEQISKFRLS